jgi:hypothetical protein
MTTRQHAAGAGLLLLLAGGAALAIATPAQAHAPSPSTPASTVSAVPGAPQSPSLVGTAVAIPSAVTSSAAGPIQVPAGHVQPRSSASSWEIGAIAGLGGVLLAAGGAVALRRR